MHGSMHAMDDSTAYFVMAVSYRHKMFMKLTPVGSSTFGSSATTSSGSPPSPSWTSVTKMLSGFNKVSLTRLIF